MEWEEEGGEEGEEGGEEERRERRVDRWERRKETACQKWLSRQVVIPERARKRTSA